MDDVGGHSEDVVQPEGGPMARTTEELLAAGPRSSSPFASSEVQQRGQEVQQVQHQSFSLPLPDEEVVTQTGLSVP